MSRKHLDVLPQRIQMSYKDVSEKVRLARFGVTHLMPTSGLTLPQGEMRVLYPINRFNKKLLLYTVILLHSIRRGFCKALDDFRELQGHLYVLVEQFWRVHVCRQLRGAGRRERKGIMAVGRI